MVLDIIIILIFLISTLRGKAKGLGDTVLRLVALVLSVGLGVKFTRTVAGFITVTKVDEVLIENLREAAQSDTIDFAKLLPGRTGSLLEMLTGDPTMEITRCAELLILVFSFVLIVMAVWSVTSFLRRKLRRSREEGGLIGTVDSTVGLLYGALRGAVLVMLMLAFMLPFAGIFMPGKIAVINENLNNSYIAGFLYDINPLLMFIRKLPF